MEATVENRNESFVVVVGAFLLFCTIVAGVIFVGRPYMERRAEESARASLAADSAESDPMTRYHRLTDYLAPNDITLFAVPEWVDEVRGQRIARGEQALEAALLAGSREAISVVYANRYVHLELQDKHPLNQARRSTILRRLSYAWPNVGAMDTYRRIGFVWDAERCHLYEGPEPDAATVAACIAQAARIPDGLYDALVGGPITR